MVEKEKNSPVVELIDEQTMFTVAELCRSCAVEAEFIEAMVEQGILEPVEQRGPSACFGYTSLRRTRITIRLQRDLGVNMSGAAVAVDLLERIESLQAQLRSAKKYS